MMFFPEKAGVMRFDPVMLVGIEGKIA